MGVKRVSDNVYSVGVINPSLRVFDIVMESKYGTSYNSYFIPGSKNILIDTAHHEFLEEYLYNLQCASDIKKIDYVIVNHTELDHSGSLRKLIELNPDIEIICTMPGYKYLKQIMNCDFKNIVVKDGDTLKLGKRTLKFIVAPMLHWPDSMMTWFEEDGVLFSCDFLGCHFCEPTGLDTKMHYNNEYLSEFKYYYDCIFGPFKPYVISGLQKIDGLKFNVICPSHGPILTETALDRINDYKKWSTQKNSEEKYIAVLYASAYGCTKSLAEEAYNAINTLTNKKARLIDMVLTPPDKISKEISEACAIFVGSCTINRDAPKVVWDVLSSIDAINTRKKAAGCFGSFGWSGEAVPMIKSRLQCLGYKFLGEGLKVNFVPTNTDIENIRQYATELANSIE